MKRRSVLSRSASSWRQLHSGWWWAGLLGLIVPLVLFGRSAAAQRVRGIEIIEQALALKPDDRAGRVLYRKHCVSCHGEAGRGDAAKVTPALAGQVPMYLIKQIVDFAEADRTAPEMHHVVARRAVSGPQSMRDIAAYLAALEPYAHPEVGDGRQLELGHRFYQGLCAYCHGAGGEGDEPHATPALQGQHYSYLLMQMRWLAIGHRYAVDINVSEMLDALPYAHMTAIADYASRLPDVRQRFPHVAPLTADPADERIE